VETHYTRSGVETEDRKYAGDNSGRGFRMRPALLICMGLIALVLAVFHQAGNHGFLNYDDNVYVTDNPHVAGGITGRGVVWAFSSFHASNWHPVTWISHMADVHLFGMNPRGHHFTSVAVHALSTVVLFLLLFRLTGLLWQSSFVAALFSIHPMHVESIAWVAERKDVLSAFFCFLTLHVYAEFAKKRKPALYILCLILFLLGLMSKPMLVTLPLVMLLLDYWPLNRFRKKEFGEGGGWNSPEGVLPWVLVKEKLPFLACAILSSIVTIFAQQSGGAIKGLDAVPFALRVENALISYVMYMGNMIWPDDLAVLYPIPSSFPFWQIIGSLILLLLLSVATVRARHRYPYLAMGWFWYLITLAPVIGIVQVGVQSMADRYSYIPSIGLFIMVAWGVTDAVNGLRQRKVILAILAGGIIIAKSAVTWQQLGYWRDDISLYRRTLQVTTGNYVIHNNLGNALAKQWDLDGAIREFREAIRIKPNYAAAHYNLGMAFAIRGRLDEAIEELSAALRIDPDNVKASYNLGLVLEQKRWMMENNN